MNSKHSVHRRITSCASTLNSDPIPPRTIPMKIHAYRARWASAACAVLVAALVAGCDWKGTLLEPQNPGLIDESAVNSSAAAMALKTGALGRLKLFVNCGGGECL